MTLPNSAKDELTRTTYRKAHSYSITNNIGQLLLQGQLNNQSSTIDQGFSIRPLSDKLRGDDGYKV